MFFPSKKYRKNFAVKENKRMRSFYKRHPAAKKRDKQPFWFKALSR
jgi:hypothetical protein